MNLTLLPHDPAGLAFTSNCSIVVTPNGALHALIRQVAPCEVNLTKPVSSIYHGVLSPNYKAYLSMTPLVQCDNRTPLLYHYEDPRVVCAPNGTYVMTVCSWAGQYFDDGVNFQTVAHQMVYGLSPDFKILHETHPVYGYNGRHHFANLVDEKNWIPFFYANELHFAYTIKPHRVFRIVDDYTTLEYTTAGLTDWEYGKPSGSTPLVDFDDQARLGLFHSYIAKGVERTYYLGAYLIEKHPPFRILRWTKKPLIVGSREHTASEIYHNAWSYFMGSTAPSSHKHQHAVVYPCSLLRQGDTWLAGCGVNEIASGVLSFSTKEVEDLL